MLTIRRSTAWVLGKKILNLIVLFNLNFLNFFFQLYGVVMEKIFRIPGLKKEGLYLTLVQFIFYTTFAKVDLYRQGHSRQISFKTYLILAGATMTTMGLSNASLGYLNYPTQVVFKCCKLIPVLIGEFY